MNCITHHLRNSLLTTDQILQGFIRNASKKTGGSTRNTSPKVRAKHRGLKKWEGEVVTEGSILALQRTLRFHPGLNVGMGRNGTLFAMTKGKVAITCEQTDLNWDHTWVQRCHSDRIGTTFFKKYINILPEQQHQRFKLIEQL